MSYRNIGVPLKNQVSHRLLREHGDNLLKSFILSLRSLHLCARPKSLNHVLLLTIFLSVLFVPLCSCIAETDSPATQPKNVILYENWEKKNFKNWDDDFSQGDTTIDTDPVYEGKYAVKQRASGPGSLVHFLGDHPGVDKKTVEDVTLESYLYFPAGFQWPSAGITLWTMACFEGWSAGYNKAKGAGKPLAWAPFYVMIALKGSGAPAAFLTRADDLGGPGELYLTYAQNIGETKPIESGAWTKLKFRLKLNTPGKVDGTFQLWINDDLKCNYPNIDFRGSYEKFGWNHLMMSFLGSSSKSDSQWLSRDNILLTGEEAASYVPTVRKKIVKKPPPPEPVAKSDQPQLGQESEKPTIPKPPTGLSIVSSGGGTQQTLIPTLPEGNNGLAAKYPGDKGIEKDPSVVFVEKFDDGPGYEILNPIALQLIFSRWDTVKGKEIMSLSNDIPQGSADERSLLMTHEHGQESGYLYRRLLPGHERVFVRYYVKFDTECAPLHHFGAWIGGYNPPTAWPQGGAGTRPSGTDRFMTGVEPYTDDWAWDFYTYWQGMHAHGGGGKYWGTTFLVYGLKPFVEKGKWVCVETMVQMNNPVTSSNGSQAFWVDGKLFRRDGQIVSYFGPGFPRGEWTGGWWKPDSNSDSAFEGFQWRSVEELAINFLWIQAYRPKTPKGSISKLWIDNIVVANEYIGPISSP